MYAIRSYYVLHSRAWYYIHITADPSDENTVWVLNVPLMKSIDGGATWEKISTPHSDHHDQWINPDNSLNMINGNDGGATITFDGGETWSSLMNQPTAHRITSYNVCYTKLLRLKMWFYPSVRRFGETI